MNLIKVSAKLLKLQLLFQIFFPMKSIKVLILMLHKSTNRWHWQDMLKTCQAFWHFIPLICVLVAKVHSKSCSKFFAPVYEHCEAALHSIHDWGTMILSVLLKVKKPSLLRIDLKISFKYDLVILIEISSNFQCLFNVGQTKATHKKENFNWLH